MPPSHLPAPPDSCDPLHAAAPRLSPAKAAAAGCGHGAVAAVVDPIPQQPSRNDGSAQAGTDVQAGEAGRSVDGRGDLASAEGRGGMSVVTQWSRNDAIDFDGDPVLIDRGGEMPASAWDGRRHRGLQPVPAACMRAQAPPTHARRTSPANPEFSTEEPAA